MSIQWTIIRNPKASGGKGARKWPAIEAALQAAGLSYEAFETQHPQHAIQLTQEAIARGRRHFVAVGGDGTANEVANGILGQSEVPPLDICMGLIPIGTGNDWGRTVGIPSKLKAAVAQLKAAPEIVQDVGVVRWQENGEEKQRYFINIAGVAYDAFVGEVINKKKSQGKFTGLGYVSTVLSCLMKFETPDLSIKVDDLVLPTRPTFYALVGICKYNGGGMKHCPDAVWDDGLLDVTVVEDLSVLKAVASLPRLFNGSFVKLKQVSQYQGETAYMEAQPGALLEVDGENIGALPARFSLLPKRLRVIGKPTS